jgi:hypothetical protein
MRFDTKIKTKVYASSVILNKFQEYHTTPFFYGSPQLPTKSPWGCFVGLLKENPFERVLCDTSSSYYNRFNDQRQEFFNSLDAILINHGLRPPRLSRRALLEILLWH